MSLSACRSMSRPMNLSRSWKPGTTGCAVKKPGSAYSAACMWIGACRWWSSGDHAVVRFGEQEDTGRWTGPCFQERSLATCGANMWDHSGRPRGQGAGLACQLDMVPKALSSSGGSKPQQCCEAPPDKLALQAILEAAYATAVASWAAMPHGHPYALDPGCSQHEGMPTGRINRGHIGPHSKNFTVPTEKSSRKLMFLIPRSMLSLSCLALPSGSRTMLII